MLGALLRDADHSEQVPHRTSPPDPARAVAQSITARVPIWLVEAFPCKRKGLCRGGLLSLSVGRQGSP